MQQLIPSDVGEERLVNLWITNKRSLHTQRAYTKEIRAFQSWLNKPLESATLVDALDYVQTLTGTDNTRRRTINVLKSFYSFATKTGLYRLNIFAAVVAPTAQGAASERILAEWEVQRMIVLEEDPRNHCLLLLLYASGARVSEICNLRWKNVIERAEGGQIDVLGKGEKRRSILLHAHAWQTLQALRGSAGTNDFVFQSRQSVSRKGVPDGRQLDAMSVQRIVRQAAVRAKLEQAGHISPHWLRHSHGSHSLDHNAPITVVRDTMGHSSIAVTNVYAHARPKESSSTYLTI